MRLEISESVQSEDVFLDTLSSELDGLLDSTKNPGLDGIIELTYGYKNLEDGGRYNTTLFQKYCGVRYEKGKLINHSDNEITVSELVELFLEKSEQDIVRLTALHTGLLGNNDISDEVKKLAILGAIESIISQIEYGQNSIYFEAEKIGQGTLLTPAERPEIREKNKNFEQKLYGGKISDNRFESELVLQYYDFKISEYEAETPEEQQKK